jgi:predicted transposase/invertase (TIGR01784 family)
MQKARPDHFIDRVLLQHSAFMLQSKYEWDQLNFDNLSPDISDEERAKREIHRYEVPPTYAIWICDFPLGKQKTFRGDWAVRNKEGLTLSDKMMYIVYDLTKFTKSLEEIETVEDRWLYLLKHAGAAESLPDFSDDIIAKAIRRLLVNRASERLIMDQANDMVWTEEELDRLALYKIRAREKARAEGLAEGREQERIETALDMLADNKPIEEIVKYSHLSMEKVLELRDSQAAFTAK